MNGRKERRKKTMKDKGVREGEKRVNERKKEQEESG